MSTVNILEGMTTNFTLAETTEVSPTLSAEVQAQVDYYHNIINGLSLYVCPIILFGGTVGNILTIVVVLSRHFRYSPSSILLLALAFIDIGVLYVALLDVWLGALLGTKFLYTRQTSAVGCRLSTFLTYFFSHCSSWTLVLINIDRVISVYQPLKARTWCTRRRLSIALIIMVVVLALTNIHVFWTVHLLPEQTHYGCRFNNDVISSKQETAWSVIDATLFTFAPFILILGCNIAIISALLQASKRRAEMEGKVRQSHDSTSSVTTMLITISIVFLISTSPLTICYQFYDIIYERYENDAVGRALYFELIINNVLVLLCYLNNAVNFLLYCISGSKFRRALIDLCGGSRRRRANSEPSTMHTSVTTRQGGVNKMSLTDLRPNKGNKASNGQVGERTYQSNELLKTVLYEVHEDSGKQGYSNPECAN